MASITDPPPKKNIRPSSSLLPAGFLHPKDLDTGGSKFIGMDQAQQTESDQGIQVGGVGGIGAAETSGRLMSWMDMINPFFVWPLKDGTNTTLKYM